MDCDKSPECPSTDGHWWNCITGRRIWRQDNHTTTVDAAAFLEGQRGQLEDKG